MAKDSDVKDERRYSNDGGGDDEVREEASKLCRAALLNPPWVSFF